MKRTITLLLLAALILAGCGESGQPADTTADSDTPQTDAVETGITPDLPDLNLNGETITIMYRDSMKNEFWTEEQNGEIVNDAIHTRNKAVEERFNCVLEYIPNVDTNWGGGYQGVISQSILAGDEAYDIVSGPSYHITSLIPEKMMCDLNTIDHLDFDKPWWNQGLLDTTSIGNKIYFVSGDISLGMIKYLHCTFFNKRLAEDNKMGDLYKTVLDGKWTVDKMEELTKDKYSDVNSDGIVDFAADSFGYVINDQNLWRAYIDALGVNLIRFNKDNMPELNLSDERAFEVYDLFLKWCGTGSSGDIVLTDKNDTAYNIFTNGRSVFTMGRFVDAETSYREMKDDWGILPVPKWDETQKDYNVTICGSESTFGIPINSSKTDYLGAIMEALAYESYKTVTPAYYESALKIKYSRDALDAQIIDIIKNGSRFNPTVQLGKLVGKDGGMAKIIIASAVSADSKPLASALAEKEEVWKQHVDDLIALMNE